jgi:hypothetical protein
MGVPAQPSPAGQSIQRNFMVRERAGRGVGGWVGGGSEGRGGLPLPTAAVMVATDSSGCRGVH